jgi:hypothetical protein
MSKRLVTGMVLALALTSTAAPAALAEDQVTSVMTPAGIAQPEDWAANQEHPRWLSKQSLRLRSCHRQSHQLSTASRLN